MKYKYTMILSLVDLSQLTSSMEATDIKLTHKVIVEVSSNLNEGDKKKELDSKIGTKTPDGTYEFIGYEDLVKVIE
jgi:hypothetical protein